MKGLSRAGAAARRGVARLVPAGRRDWVEAVWAEAPEAPPGLRRLAWRAGGVRLIAREALMRRGIGSALLFGAAARLGLWDNAATGQGDPPRGGGPPGPEPVPNPPDGAQLAGCNR
ncbi:MAG TPA: hypothetical protein VH589_16595 [Trebonia sp.]|jgi:hypothetical protein